MKKLNIVVIKVLFFSKDVDIKKVLLSKKISGKKAASALLVTVIRIIKFNHRFLKQMRM